MNKRWFILLLITSLCYQYNKIQAQTNTASRFEKSNDIILVDIPFNMTEYFVDDDEYLILTPVIQSDTESLDLLKIVLYGKNKAVSESDYGAVKPYAILNTMNRQSFVYQVDVSYQPWMNSSTLKLKKVLHDSDGAIKYELVNTVNTYLVQGQSQSSVQEAKMPPLTIQQTAPEVTTFGSYQQTNQQDNLANHFSKNGNGVIVNIKLRMTDYFVDDYESLVLTPAIQADSKYLDLQSVILNGKWQSRTSLKDISIQPYTVQNVTNRDDITYYINIPYEPWMENANLKLKRTLYNSEGNKDYEISAVINNGLTTGSYQQLSQSQPIHETTEKATYINISPYTHKSENIYDMYFPSKNSRSVSELTKNSIAMENMCNKLDSIFSKNNNAQVSLTITVGTCPYGIYMDNEELTKKQALILKAYMEGRYNQYNLNINTNWISEDWAGLIKLIEEDEYFPYKQESLNIINNTGIFKGREKKLMDLARGDAYRYMKAHYFPKLWKAGFKIDSYQ